MPARRRQTGRGGNQLGHGLTLVAKLLPVVFGEIQLPSAERRHDILGGHGLADRQKTQGQGGTAAGYQSRIHAIIHGLEIGNDLFDPGHGKTPKAGGG